MKKEISDEFTLKEIEKILRPSLIQHWGLGAVLLGPYLHFFLIIADKNYGELPKLVIINGITLPLFTLNWVWYFYELKRSKIESKKIYEEILSDKEYNE